MKKDNRKVQWDSLMRRFVTKQINQALVTCLNNARTNEKRGCSFWGDAWLDISNAASKFHKMPNEGKMSQEILSLIYHFYFSFRFFKAISFFSVCKLFYQHNCECVKWATQLLAFKRFRSITPLRLRIPGRFSPANKLN